MREPPHCNVTPFSPPTVDLLAWLTPARCLLARAVHRDLVVDVHTDYLLAGADIITTNNFVCVEHQLAREGLQAELVSMTQAAASCATQAV